MIPSHFKDVINSTSQVLRIDFNRVSPGVQLGGSVSDGDYYSGRMKYLTNLFSVSLFFSFFCLKRISKRCENECTVLLRVLDRILSSVGKKNKEEYFLGRLRSNDFHSHKRNRIRACFGNKSYN